MKHHFNKKFNNFEILEDGKTVKIELTQGKFGYCDLEDWERLKECCWHSHKDSTTGNYYVQTNISIFVDGKRKQKIVQMHRMILEVENYKIKINHKNFNTLNNCRNNIEICSNAENKQYSKKHKDNTSGYKGVTWHKKQQCWTVQIGINYKNIHLGSFDNIIDAAQAYNEAAIKYHGKFAILNEISNDINT